MAEVSPSTPFHKAHSGLVIGVTESLLQLANKTTTTPRPEIIDPQLLLTLRLIFGYGLQVPLLSFGVVTNILNIIIFRLSGLKDSISLTFTALSISDMMYCVIFLLCDILGIIGDLFEVWSKIRIARYGVATCIADFIFYFQDLSVLITVFAAVQKCCCVTMPHLFKNYFTTRKTIFIIAIFSLAMLLTYIPIYAGMSFTSPMFSSITNETIPATLVYGELYMESGTVWRYNNKLVIPTISQAIMVVCLVLMLTKLRESMQFRQSAVKDTEVSDENEPLKLGYKERRAITAVIIVLVIFIVSTIPATVLTYCELIFESFFQDPFNRPFRTLFQHSHTLAIQAGVSVNIFVYLKYNSKYRETAVSLFETKDKRHL